MSGQSKNILVIEDDDLMQGMLKETLTKEGYTVTIAGDGIEGAEKFRKSPDFKLVLTDLKLPKMDGVSLLKKIRESSPETPVIIMTAYGTVETAVQAMKLGAYDYITKPFLAEELTLLVGKALELSSLKEEVALLRRELNGRYSLHNIVGKSKAIQEIYRLIETIAPGSANVLIQGESGTGKELVAEAIHHLGPRKDKPLIKVSCAALPETLLESELFGHEKGAFTDAVSRKKGRFELADSGTLFLDDVDDLSPTVQVKLLRVLQEKEFERVGGTETIKVDVRVIAATKTDLRQKIAAGTFREDLFYRLNVVPVNLPPLRDRTEDIPLLVDSFLKRFNHETNKQVTISNEALAAMLHYNWPGNIRELENLIERLVTMSQNNEVTVQDLPSNMTQNKNPDYTPGWQPAPLQKISREAEKQHILKVLEFTKWHKKEAAEILNITPKTLWQKLKEYGIEE